VWPMRKLIQEFQDELFRVVPCWLASPESVSAIFPLEKYFDLVIFDEASQCFPEWGLPAIFRGKQLIVAGDSKQLRPGDFYRIRWQDDGEEDVFMETESLLELAQLQLPSFRLQAHYRSRHPDLIAFSNRHFYKNTLLTLPDQKFYNSGWKPLEYLMVKGEWKDQTNRVEAEKVAELVLKSCLESPQVSVGVITFNRPQQQLIMDVIEEYFSAHNQTIPERLFIKNIENVQGDERDLIIFSVGYAPSKNNRVALQFGSLNAEGGINRLNVAVTRAREKMIVVSSIEPSQLDLDGVKSEGPVLLKLWLEFVRDRSNSVSSEWQSPARAKHSEWYLSDRIQHTEILHNKVTNPPFAFADLVTLKNGSYHRLILTDDERYLQSPSPKLHHSFLPRLFKENNWEWISCYSRNYWINSEENMSSILVLPSNHSDPELEA